MSDLADIVTAPAATVMVADSRTLAVDGNSASTHAAANVDVDLLGSLD